MKAMDRLEDTLYAVKKVRLHLPLCDDLRQELKNHKVFREVRALASSTTQELKHTVRYFNSWLEDLTHEEIIEEQDQLIRYSHNRKRLSSINENDERQHSNPDMQSNDSLTGNSKQKLKTDPYKTDSFNSDCSDLSDDKDDDYD